MSTCGCNDCNNTTAVVDYCNPESIESQISNFITSFVGTLTKTSTNGVCVWELPCDLDDEIPAFPREANEGVLCYIYRILATGAIVGEANTGANVGAGTGLSFRDKTGVTLNFRSLLAGLNIGITNNANDITIAFTLAAFPANKTAAGTMGQFAFSGNRIAFCYAANSWAVWQIAKDWV